MVQLITTVPELEQGALVSNDSLIQLCITSHMTDVTVLSVFPRGFAQGQMRCFSESLAGKLSSVHASHLIGITVAHFVK